MSRFSKLFRFGQSSATTQDDLKSPPSRSSERKSLERCSHDGAIDIVFLQDTTGSQMPYIHSARKAIKHICEKISTSTDVPSKNIRFGLIAFRDYLPPPNSYLTRNFGFTSSTTVMKWNLKNITADQGGDGPEASTAALAEALHMKWREKAIKMVVLITDAPPHGIGEPHDEFEVSPDGYDPLEIARQMAEQGITLFVVACEPTMSAYINAVDFYKALTEITGGKMLPLTMADRLGDYIAGTAVETIDIEKLIGQYSPEIVDKVYGQSRSILSATVETYEELKQKGVKLKHVDVEDVYTESSIVAENVEIWKKSEKVSDARVKVSRINEPRMQKEYSSGQAAPSAQLVDSDIQYAAAQRVVMQSIMRISKVTAGGMVRQDPDPSPAS